MTRILGFDTETFLITKDDVNPRPVCCTWADGQNAWITKPDDEVTLALIASLDTVFVGANIPYDFACMMRWHPHMIPHIIRAYDEGRVFDVQVRERLIICATEGRDVKRLSLSDLVTKYLGEDRSALKAKLDINGKVIGNEDAWRLRYGTLINVELDKWPAEALSYAIGDARDTLNVFNQQGGIPATFPTEALDCQGDFSLRLASSWGMMIHQKNLEAKGLELEKELAGFKEKIGSRGLSGTGSKQRQQQAACTAWRTYQLNWVRVYCAEKALGIDETFLQHVPADTDIHTWILAHHKKNYREMPPFIWDTQENWNPPHYLKIMTEEMPQPSIGKTGYTFSADALKPLYGIDPDFKTYADMKHSEKMLSTYIKPYREKCNYAVHPRYTPIVSTGRTSCSGPNVQNIPRDGGFRNNFAPRPGFLYGTGDYSALELCTLAETIIDLQGASELANKINAGMDPHCITAAAIVGKSYEEVVAGKKGIYKEARQGAKACYSADTELLTKEGWVRIDALFEKEEEIAQYCPHKKIISFTKPQAWTKQWADEVYRFVNDYQDCIVSGDHRMLQATKNGNIQEVHARDYANNSQYSSVHGGFFDTMLTLTEAQTRLAVMVQADGNFNKNKVRLGFSKKRKIDRCREVLGAAGIEYKEKQSGEVTTFSLDKSHINKVLLPDKTFIKEIGIYDSIAFCKELRHWDGSTIKKHTSIYTNTKKEDVEYAQTILILSGYKATMRVEYAQGKLPCWKVTWYNGDWKKNPAYARLSGLTRNLEEAQTVYCPTVPTSWVLTRRKGKVVVHGNCNFGRPGGLVSKTFVNYAAGKPYYLELTHQEAKDIFSAHSQAFPEVDSYLSHGKTEMDKAGGGWHSRVIAKNLNGRTRGNCRYTELMNFPFQSLAADGAKRAMYWVTREQLLSWHHRNGGSPDSYGAELRESPLHSSHLVNFIHDELVGEHAKENAEEAFKRQIYLMEAAMQSMVPHVKISTEGELSDHWAH